MDTAPAPRKRFDPVAYLKLFRFPLVFTAIADSAAGYLLGLEGRPPIPSTVGFLAISSAGLYFFGMALNDIADRETDKRIAPGRVLPAGRLSVRAALIAAFVVLFGSLGSLVAINAAPVAQRILVWGMVVASIVAYNLFLKLPPVMGLVRAFNFLLGVSAAISMSQLWNDSPWVFAVTAFPEFLYVSALTYVSTLEDEGLDRNKILLGTAFMALGALLAAVLIPIWLVSRDAFEAHLIVKRAMKSWHGVVFASLLVLWLLRRAWMARDKKGIMLMVRDGVGGIILLDAALVGSLCGLIPALCVAALVIPAVVSVAIFKKLA